MSPSCIPPNLTLAFKAVFLAKPMFCTWFLWYLWQVSVKSHRLFPGPSGRWLAAVRCPKEFQKHPNKPRGDCGLMDTAVTPAPDAGFTRASSVSITVLEHPYLTSTSWGTGITNSMAVQLTRGRVNDCGPSWHKINPGFISLSLKEIYSPPLQADNLEDSL